MVSTIIHGAVPIGTDTKVRNAKPRDALYKLTDDRGLCLLVAPNGGAGADRGGRRSSQQSSCTPYSRADGDSKRNRTTQERTQKRGSLPSPASAT